MKNDLPPAWLFEVAIPDNIKTVNQLHINAWNGNS